MEIKIIHRKSEQEFAKTHLFEGDDIYYYLDEFKIKDEFVKKYNYHTNKMYGHVIGVPDDVWKNDGPEQAGTFCILFYTKPGGELNFIVTMNSRVYITNKGQTVDTVVL